MFKVPADPHRPAETISFWRWLTSSKQDRLEWQARRNAAGRARVQQADARVQHAQQARQQYVADKHARKAAKRHARQVRKTR